MVKPSVVGTRRSPGPQNNRKIGTGLPWDRSRSGLDPQGRITPVGPMKPGHRYSDGLARGAGEEVNPRTRLGDTPAPRALCPVTLPAPGALGRGGGGWCPMAATGPPGIHCERPPLCRTSLPPGPVGSRRVNVLLRPPHGGDAEMPETRAGASDSRASRPSDSAQDGGSGNSRAASRVSDDRAMLQPLSSSVSGPVRPGRSHLDRYNRPTTAFPFRLFGAQTRSHFKEKPISHAPSRSREANPRAATPR